MMLYHTQCYVIQCLFHLFLEPELSEYESAADESRDRDVSTYYTPANFVCGGYTVFTLSVRPCVRASVRNVLFF